MALPSYQKYLEKIVELTRAVTNPTSGESYSKALNTPAKRALYDNLGNDEALALTVDAAVHASRQDDWRSNPIKIKMVRLAIKDALRRTRKHGSAQAGRVAEAPGSYGVESAESFDDLVERIVELVKNQNEY